MNHFGLYYYCIALLVFVEDLVHILVEYDCDSVRRIHVQTLTQILE